MKALLQQALDFCVFCWRDVDMNDYAFERLETTIDALRTELAKPELEPKQSLAGLVEILHEAAEFIHSVNLGESPSCRYPIVDELAGFAGILADIGTLYTKEQL